MRCEVRGEVEKAAHRRIEVAIRYAWEDGGVDHAQPVHSMHAAGAIDDGCRIARTSHLARATRMVCGLEMFHQVLIEITI